MAEQRMIQCPRCNGHEFLYGEIGPEPVAFGCPVCRGSGTIPDRRAPSAAEDALRAEVAAANERAGRYRSALRSLVNEVGASAGAFEDEVREAVGNTNYACLMDKVEQARKALEVPDAM
jgi:hypothetical protein